MDRLFGDLLPTAPERIMAIAQKGPSTSVTGVSCRPSTTPARLTTSAWWTPRPATCTPATRRGLRARRRKTSTRHAAAGLRLGPDPVVPSRDAGRPADPAAVQPLRARDGHRRHSRCVGGRTARVGGGCSDRPGADPRLRPCDRHGGGARSGEAPADVRRSGRPCANRRSCPGRRRTSPGSCGGWTARTRTDRARVGHSLGEGTGVQAHRGSGRQIERLGIPEDGDGDATVGRGVRGNPCASLPNNHRVGWARSPVRRGRTIRRRRHRRPPTPAAHPPPAQPAPPGRHIG